MKIIHLILIGSLIFSSCAETEIEVKHSEGYIVGFDPCTIRHGYRIGYVIISKDMKDTLITYNLSDKIFKMPASVLFDSLDTLYKVPESYFQNYMASGYFPVEARYEFNVEFSYTRAEESEKVIHQCLADFNQGDFSKQILQDQIIVKSATK